RNCQRSLRQHIRHHRKSPFQVVAFLRKPAHMGKFLIASILLCLPFSVSSRSQQRIDSTAIQAIERDVVTLLLKEDLGKIVNQLEDDSPPTDSLYASRPSGWRTQNPGAT